MILCTGGAGFIGSHLVDALLERGHKVRVLDSFVKQVHGVRPHSLPSEVEVIQGDIRDRVSVEWALANVDVVFHQAAEVGVGQSMSEIRRYVEANSAGTAVLLEVMAARRGQIKKLIVASSMSVYGEGAYRDRQPIPTPETHPLNPASVYAITKQDQEQLCLTVGRAYGIPTVALRYFNVYGSRQSLSNPYTGVAAIFASRLLKGQPPIIYEDGNQSRDFTHVSDIVQANLRAMEMDAADDQAINVGTGVAHTVGGLAYLLAAELGVSIEPHITNTRRNGDIRHCYADISKARRLLGYEPTVALEQGVFHLIAWAREQQPQYSTARSESHA